MSKECSIVVPLWNHLDDVTKPFIEQILKTKDVDLEIIFVDNGSSDGTYDYLEERLYPTLPGIDIVKVGVQYNIGYSGGMNTGYGFSTGKYICFMNNDVEVDDPLWLRKMLDYADAHPKTALGPELVLDEVSTDYKGKCVPFLNGWCVLVEAEFLEKYGAFHPAFQKQYFEDVEICARMVHYGYKLERFPAMIRHLGARTTNDQIDRTASVVANHKVFMDLMDLMEKDSPPGRYTAKR